MVKAKPCPFCGSIPEVDRSSWRHFRHPEYEGELVAQRVRIKCSECHCTKDIVKNALCLSALPEKEYKKVAKKLADDIIEEAWNKYIK